ncbi:hypothetical protein ABFX02_09G026300 [Erythranthe guttata]
MSQKRQQPEEGTSFDERRPRKSPSFRSVVRDVINLCKLQNLIEPVLEPLIRRVVKEEVDSALRNYAISMNRNCGKEIQQNPPESRSLQLRFLSAISLPVFTGTRIEGEGCSNMEVALFDNLIGEVISDGIGSSAKVEIVVLEGDFNGDERENWTFDEFRNNTVRERQGKKSLLNGDVIVNIRDGTGFLGNVIFTDNSSWTRSRKFRLGARFMDNIGDVRVREAISEPFVVRDHRGELYKKHHPPSLSDEVWRLEKIGKDGAFHKRLRNERVNTVQDFLMLFFLDPTRLRNILGTGMSGKMWDIAVEHARTCVLDKKLYLYGPSQKNAVVFNVVGELMGIFSSGNYFPVDNLSKAEKANAHESIISAFQDRKKILPFEDESSLITQSSSNLPSEDITSHSYLQQSPFSPNYMHSSFSIGGFDDCLSGGDLTCDEPLVYSGPAADNLICDNLNEHLEYFETDFPIHGAVNSFIPCSSNPTIRKAQRGWNVLVSVLRWWFTIKRIRARKNTG